MQRDPEMFYILFCDDDRVRLSMLPAKNIPAVGEMRTPELLARSQADQLEASARMTLKLFEQHDDLNWSNDMLYSATVWTVSAILAGNMLGKTLAKGGVMVVFTRQPDERVRYMLAEFAPGELEDYLATIAPEDLIDAYAPSPQHLNMLGAPAGEVVH